MNTDIHKQIAALSPPRNPAETTLLELAASNLGRAARVRQQAAQCEPASMAAIIHNHNVQRYEAYVLALIKAIQTYREQGT